MSNIIDFPSPDASPITEEMLVDFLIDHEIESAEELDTFSQIVPVSYTHLRAHET